MQSILDPPLPPRRPRLTRRRRPPSASGPSSSRWRPQRLRAPPTRSCRRSSSRSTSTSTAPTLTTIARALRAGPADRARLRAVASHLAWRPFSRRTRLAADSNETHRKAYASSAAARRSAAGAAGEASSREEKPFAQYAKGAGHGKEACAQPPPQTHLCARLRRDIMNYYRLRSAPPEDASNYAVGMLEDGAPLEPALLAARPGTQPSPFPRPTTPNFRVPSQASCTLMRCRTCCSCGQAFSTRRASCPRIRATRLPRP